MRVKPIVVTIINGELKEWKEMVLQYSWDSPTDVALDKGVTRGALFVWGSLSFLPSFQLEFGIHLVESLEERKKILKLGSNENPTLQNTFSYYYKLFNSENVRNSGV